MDLGILGGFEAFGRRYRCLPFDVIEAVDHSRDAVEAYGLNLGAHCRLADLAVLPVESLPEAEVLLGGFPCQDFSSSGPKVGLASHRGQLYQVLVEYMRVYRPKVVVGENVPHLARLRGGRYLEAMIRDFESEGYHFDVWELYAPDFGLPQSRRRLFLVGVRNDLPGFPIPPVATHLGTHLTTREALFDLEEFTREQVPNQSQYFVATRATSGGGQGRGVHCLCFLQRSCTV